MEFKKDDENYIYEVISKNVKKYRKLKGWTQEKLASEINYSLSFISGIESNYHQTFSLGAIWRISRALDIDCAKLCEDHSLIGKAKCIEYQCNTCGEITKFPTKMVRILNDLHDITNSKDLPTFDCTKEECTGKIIPINPLDF